MSNEPLPQPAPIKELPNLFREEAARAEPYAPKAARLWRRAADWLEISMAAHLDEIIPIARAATEAGWSYEALRRRVSQDASLNAGVPGAPAIRRSDLARLGPPRGKRQKCAGQETVITFKGAAPPSQPFDRVLARVHSTIGGAR